MIKRDMWVIDCALSAVMKLKVGITCILNGLSNWVWKMILLKCLFHRDGMCWDDELKCTITSFKEKSGLLCAD